MMLRGILLTSALVLMAVPALARENYALLIGASTYPNLAEKYWLKGPANDVRLVQTYLTTAAPVPFTPQNVTLLADGVEGAAAPTLSGIRSAMADLTARVQPGDFVYLHFSGHGTQEPAANPDSELDGLDEVFLPTDIGPWSDETGAVENALVDDEIGAMIDALRAKGADVWAVFDSCHSGTVTRGAPDDDDVRLRQLPPDALGIPETATSRNLQNPQTAPEAPFDAGSATGSFVAFFAAQTNEVTPEKNLPKGKPGRIPQGVFTYTLFQVLAEYPQASYGQIGQEVLRSYATKKLATTTPMFQGDLDRVAFSGTPGARVAQWTATVADGRFTLPAGSLHGLTTGAILAVMGRATDPNDAALAYVKLTNVETFTASGTVTADKPLPEKLPTGLLLRKIGADVDFTLTIALPEAGTAAATALAAAQQALTTAAGPRLVFVPAGAEADLRLAVLPDSPRPDALWVLPATGLADDLTITPSVDTADKDAGELAETLADTLTTMARALNLQRLGAAVGPGDLDVSVALRTGPNKNALTTMPASSVPRLIPDDQVHILAQNHMDQPVDVNVLYIAADYSISHWFAGRLNPGDTLKEGLFKISDAVLGAERMVVVLTPAQAQTPVEDLSFLAQDSLVLSRSLRGTPGLTAALEEAGFGSTTRSATALDDGTASGPAPGIVQMELRTVPAN
jgi:hypothetical protein